MLRIAITLIALFVYISVFSQDSVPHQPKAERSNSAVQPHSQKDSLLNSAYYSNISINNGKITSVKYRIDRVLRDGVIVYDTIPMNDNAPMSKREIEPRQKYDDSYDTYCGGFYDNPGYEWAYQMIKMECVEKKYPIEEKYYTHPEHPGYKVYANGRNVRGDPYCIVKDGKLVRVLYDNDNICESVIQSLVRYAYEHNVYKIKGESYSVQLNVKSHAGLIRQSELIKTKGWMNGAEKAGRYKDQILLDCNIQDRNFSSFIRHHQSDTEVICTTEGNKFKVKVSYSLQNGKIKKTFTVIKSPW